MLTIFADYTDESNIFDLNIQKANCEFMESMTHYLELFSDEGYISESEKDTLVTSIKKFFTNLISSLQSFINSIKEEVGRQVRFSSTDSKLHKMYKELVAQKEKGCKQVKVMDVWSIEAQYLKDVDELKKLSKKFSKMKYKRVSDLNEDISRFNELYEKYDKELNQMAENTIVVPIDKMINFVEDEISNRSKVMDTLNECVSMMEMMRDDADLINKRYEMLGADIVPKHMSFLKKMGISISSFIKKWVVKIITKVVWVFA